MASSFHRHGADESSDEEDGDNPAVQPSNAAYVEFLQFLRLGCGGSAVQFYPAIVVIVSKFPESVSPRSSSFFTVGNISWRSSVVVSSRERNGDGFV